jgi:hypothetical protein
MYFLDKESNKMEVENLVPSYVMKWLLENKKKMSQNYMLNKA